MSNSTAENGKRGTTRVRNGINNRMMMGNPTAADATQNENKTKQKMRCIKFGCITFNVINV
jgi:hypothetical protein